MKSLSPKSSKVAATIQKGEVLREGVRIIQDREARLVALDVSLAQGIADEEAGRVTPLDDVFLRLDEKYRNVAVKSTAA